VIILTEGDGHFSGRPIIGLGSLTNCIDWTI